MWRVDGVGEIYDYLFVFYIGIDDGYGEFSEYYLYFVDVLVLIFV